MQNKKKCNLKDQKRNKVSQVWSANTSRLAAGVGDEVADGCVCPPHPAAPVRDTGAVSVQGRRGGENKSPLRHQPAWPSPGDHAGTSGLGPRLSEGRPEPPLRSTAATGAAVRRACDHAKHGPRRRMQAEPTRGGPGPRAPGGQAGMTGRDLSYRERRVPLSPEPMPGRLRTLLLGTRTVRQH